MQLLLRRRRSFCKQSNHSLEEHPLPLSRSPSITNVLRSRPLRRTCSAYLSTSQPFSACICGRGFLLSWGIFPKFFAFFAFRDVLPPPLFFFSFFRCFVFFPATSTSRCTFPPFFTHKNSSVSFLSFDFLSFLICSSHVTREDKARQI